MDHWSIPGSQSSESHGQSRSYPGSPSLARRRSFPNSAGSPDDYYTTLTRHGDATPPLPPRTRAGPPSTPTPPPRRKSSLPYSTPVLLEDKGPFSLRTFISKYGHVLPLRLSVGKGHHSGDERRSIAMGDLYNVHFVKHCQVAVLKDSSGTIYNIPLSSSLQFAPIFSDSEPSGDTELRFETVADVIKHKPLPRILRALNTHSSDEQSSVERNEILLVQEVVQSTKNKKKALKVYSDTKMKEKILPSNCVGHFTADPYATRLHLPTIVLHFREELPLNVQVYISDIDTSEYSGDFPFHLASEVSQIAEIITETSLVVTTHFQKGQSGDDTSQIEIPIDLPIEVSILQPDPTEEKEADLLHRTRTLFEAFDPSRIHSIRVSSSELSTALRKGYEREGVELQRPGRVYDVPPRRAQSPIPPKRELSPVNKQDPPQMLLERDPPPMLPERDPPPPLPKRNPAPLFPRCDVLPTLHKRTPPPVIPKRDVPTIRHTPAPMPAKRANNELFRSWSHEQPPSLGTQSLDRRKREMVRVDSGHYVELNGGHTYQSLLIPPPTTSQDDLYATISTGTRPAPPSRAGVRSHQVASQNIASTSNVGELQFPMDVEDASPLIRHLISRIESLEQQVVSLSDQVEKLQK